MSTAATVCPMHRARIARSSRVSHPPRAGFSRTVSACPWIRRATSACPSARSNWLCQARARAHTRRHVASCAIVLARLAALAALIISEQPQLAGQVDWLEKTILDNALPITTTQECGGTANQVPNNVYGWGRIDALNAVSNYHFFTYFPIMIYNP